MIDVKGPGPWSGKYVFPAQKATALTQGPIAQEELYGAEAVCLDAEVVAKQKQDQVHIIQKLQKQPNRKQGKNDSNTARKHLVGALVLLLWIGCLAWWNCVKRVDESEAACDACIGQATSAQKPVAEPDAATLSLPTASSGSQLRVDFETLPDGKAEAYSTESGCHPACWKS